MALVRRFINGDPGECVMVLDPEEALNLLRLLSQHSTDSKFSTYSIFGALVEVFYYDLDLEKVKNIRNDFGYINIYEES